MTKNHKINHFYNRYLAKSKKKCLEISKNLYQSGITLNRVTWIRDLCLPDQGYGLPGSGAQKPRSGKKCKQNLVIFGKLIKNKVNSDQNEAVS